MSDAGVRDPREHSRRTSSAASRPSERRPTRHLGGTSMADDELTRAGKAGIGAACVVCCVAPLLVVAGVVSLASLLTVGIALGSVMLIGLSVWDLDRKSIRLNSSH